MSGSRPPRRRRRKRRSSFRWWYVVVPCFMVFILGALVLALWPVFGPDNARHAMAKNNLKHVGISLSNYHETHLVFPPGGVFDEQGKAHHGWQTMLLPFVEQAQLYRRINFDVPWTDPRNQQWFHYRIEAYETPGVEQVQANGFALSHIAGNVHVFSRNSSVRARDFAKGTRHTMVAGQVSAGFRPWGDTENFRDPLKGLHFDGQTFGGPNHGRTAVLMGDGSVRVLDKDTDPEILRKIGTLKYDDPKPGGR